MLYAYKEKEMLLLRFQEGTFFEVTEGIAELFLRVHYNRAVPRDGFFEGLAGNQQEADAIVARLDHHFIASIENDE